MSLQNLIDLHITCSLLDLFFFILHFIYFNSSFKFYILVQISGLYRFGLPPGQDAPSGTDRVREGLLNRGARPNFGHVWL